MSERAFLPKSEAWWRSPLVRVGGLWLVLIGMFLAIWLVLGQGHGAAPADHVRTSAPDYRPTAMFFVFFAIILAFFLYLQRRFRRFSTANAAGLQALADGEYEKAGSTFERLARSYRWPKLVRTVSAQNLAIARLYQGRLPEALSALETAERESRWAPHLRPNIAAFLAVTNAVRGSLDVARRWREETAQRATSAQDPALAAGFLTFADAVIGVREGKYAEVIKTLDERWAQIEGSLTARTTRPMRVLRAFAIAQSRGKRDAGKVQKTMASLEPIRPGEFALLEAEWPEVAAFLRVHGG
ncbi:MAG TPA: hypothetical protein VHV30_03650 [Polyangiaceae bacterium]|jgi:hypothetical protein|nr:hypothetical protein [Polyangiaceae bacterium]